MVATPSSLRASRALWVRARPRLAIERAPRGARSAFVFATLAFALVLYGTARRPVGMSLDSGAYLSIGMSFHAGLGFHSLEGRYLLHWPPLYPLLLSIVDALPVSPLRAIAVLNAASVAVTVLCAGLWLGRRVRSRLVRLAALAFVAFAPSLGADVALWAWSEAPWVALSVAGLFTLDRYVARGRRGDLVAAITFAALASLTRYVGVSSLAVLGVTLLVASRGTLVRRLARATLATAIASAPIGAWVVRNYLHSKTFAGPRDPIAPGQFGPTLDAALRTLGEALWPLSPTSTAAPSFVRSFGGVVVVLLALAFVLVRVQARTRDDLRPLVAPATFVVAHVLVVVTLLSRVKADPMHERYFVALVPAIAWMSAFAADRLAALGRSAGAWSVRVSLAAATAWVLFADLREDRVRIAQFRENGGGQTGAAYDGFAEFLRAHWPSAGEVWSNCPEFVLCRLGRRVPFGPPSPLPREWAAQGGTLVWLHEESDRVSDNAFVGRLGTRAAHPLGAVVVIRPR